MQRYKSIQSYVPALVADWIADLALARETSLSVVVREIVVDAWRRDCDAPEHPPGADPGHQLTFLVTGMDALLARHADEGLRQEVHDAYQRRLVAQNHRSTAKGGNSDEE